MEFIDVADAAQKLRVSSDSLRMLCETGQIKAFRPSLDGDWQLNLQDFAVLNLVNQIRDGKIAFFWTLVASLQC